MGLFQKAIETYDAHAYLIGTTIAGHVPLAPIAHTVQKVQLEVTIDKYGNFVSVEQIDVKNQWTVFPITEESNNRTSTGAAEHPHPLTDKLQYYINVPEKIIAQLEKWRLSEYSNPKLQPIILYLKSGAIQKDMERFGCGKKMDAFVRWSVIGFENKTGPCWTDREMLNQYTSFYLKYYVDSAKELSMISGLRGAITELHPGLIFGKTKLISTNDKCGFSYRGRFTTANQAVTVSYEDSQKVHNILRWLTAEQGVTFNFGDNKNKLAFMCWNPQGKRVVHAGLPIQKRLIETKSPSDYKQELKRTLEGYKSELPDGCGGVVIAAFQAVTNGRVALTYYNELRESDFLQRLYDWDMSCAWWQWNPETKMYDRVQSPPLWKIIQCAFGTQREDEKEEKLKIEEWMEKAQSTTIAPKRKEKKFYLAVEPKIIKQQMQCLISCRVDKKRFPRDILQQLVWKASNPQAFAPAVYSQILSVACAAVRKYHIDYFKEDIGMMLDELRNDPSYQFGRLLAIFEMAERCTYEKDEKRVPNAIRYQSVYCQHPLRTAFMIENQLERAYFPKMSPEVQKRYKDQIQEIIVHITEQTALAECNKPLKETYLLGYYLQRRDIYEAIAERKQNKKEEEK